MAAPQSQNEARIPEPRDARRPFEKIVALAEPPLTAGSCVLGRPEIAAIVHDALLHFEGQRYHLGAWCVMPNHVHVVLTPVAGHHLSHILHTWKSFTSNKINCRLRRKGPLWERESFNHLIRNAKYIERFILYTESNPVEAGLCRAPQEWAFSSCGAGFKPAAIPFVDPRTTPFVEPHSRGELPHLHKDSGSYFVTWRLLDAVVPLAPE